MGIAPTIGGGRGGAYSLNLGGATDATRFVGGTTSGAPTTGTFAVGDFVVDQTGQMWVCVTAGSPGTWRCVTKDRVDLALAARGLIAESWPLSSATNTTFSPPTTQIAYAMLVGLRAGDVITKVVFNVGTAAVGTVPTSVIAGIADSTGKILAQTAELKNDSQWTAVGFAGFSLTAPYTITADGGYYLVLWKNGVFATTDVGLVRSHSSTLPTAFLQYGTGARANACQAANASFPANGSSLTLVGAAPSPLAFWAGAS